jgi:DnaJ like chaperone protein
MMSYRQHEKPGCGCGFFLFFLLLLLAVRPGLLLGFLGALFYAALFLVFLALAAFWGFTYFVRRKISEYEQSQTETHNTFVFLLINILIKIAQVDGQVTKAESATILRFFQDNLRYTQNQLLWVKDLVKEAMRSEVSLESLLAEFREKFAYEPRLILLELIYRVLFSNDHVADAELQLVRNIAEYLDISAFEQRSFEAKYRTGGYRAGDYRTAAAPRPRDEESYYETFGLKQGADFAEIKAAYRKLSMKYHPDKVGHLGDEFRKVAEDKMKELNVAYEYLKKKFQ